MDRKETPGVQSQGNFQKGRNQVWAEDVFGQELFFIPEVVEKINSIVALRGLNLAKQEVKARE